MKQRKTTKPAAFGLLYVILTALVTLCALWLLSFDNKYTTKAELAQESVLLPENGIAFLVDGWKLYPDSLIASQTYSSDSPSYSTWAGEYPNLAAFHSNSQPYGKASYRTVLKGSGMVSLYLQEPLCAARLWVDGVNLGGPGELEEYRPLIRDTVYSFMVNGQAELIIETANYSHYYGGLWYPPAVGSADSISRLIALRMILYGLFCFSAITLALFSTVLWLKKENRKNNASLFFGLLCLSFAVQVLYPFLRLWGVPLVNSLYALEDFSALFGLYCAVQIFRQMFAGVKMLAHTAAVIALAMCFISVLFPLVLLPNFPSLTAAYGMLISLYKLCAALWLLFAAFKACLTEHTAYSVLAASTANSIFLLSGVLLIGSFEPTVGLWPGEYGSFCMVLAFAGLMVRHYREMAAENLRLNLHLQEEVAEKTRHLSLLLVERGKLMSELSHDIKSPLTAVSNMAQIIRTGNILLDNGALDKMKSIEEKCSHLSQRLHMMQQLSEELEADPPVEELSLNRFLSDFYRNNKPVLELDGPNLLYSATPINCKVLVNQDKLSRVLENLMFNAADFTSPDGEIVLSLEVKNQLAQIKLRDTGCGIPPEALAKIFDRGYTTRAKEGGQGLGLAIAQAIIREYKGRITAESEVGQGSTFTIELPLLQ